MKSAIGEGGISAGKEESANVRLLFHRRGALFWSWSGFRMRLGLGDANLWHGDVHMDQATGEL